MKTTTLKELSKKLFFFNFLLLFPFLLLAQKPMEKRNFEITLEEDETIKTEIRANKRIDLATGKIVALYGFNYDVPNGTPEEMAHYYLQHQGRDLGISEDDLLNLQHHATRTTDAGSVVRYRQYLNGYPVNNAEVTISISPQNKVVFVMNGFQQIKPNAVASTPNIDEATAYNTALNYLNANDITYQSHRIMVYNNKKMTRLAYEVILSSTNPLGEWHIFVDAQSQEIFKVVDMNHYHSDKDKEKEDKNNNAKDANINYAVMPSIATGTGMVFNPDPLSSNQVTYGTGGYVDNNDANSTDLQNARFSVTLNDITLTGSTYSLVGPRAEIIDFDTPTTGLFTQTSSDFSFTRDAQGFEPVNVYYHIDFMMNYINNTLGCTVLPYQYTGGVQYDPHGAGGADNSYYTSGAGRLSFGEGCVDDAEDSDVIHHELGHGLHDWVTSGGLSQVEGLSEGCGDYVAQSYNRSLGNWTSADAQYNWVFNWDGHNACWPGRITNYGAAYPGGLVGQIHTDGQIWASCLMALWDQIGGQQMDKIFYEGLGMTNGSSSQNDAAVAVYQAAINLSYTSSEISTIHTALSSCGYTLPPPPGPPTAMFSADAETICLDTNNTVNFTDESLSATALTWSWTFEGGSPATSTAQNPTVTYSADGTYDVTLTVTNADGSDTLTLTDYITVVSGTACPSCTTYASPENLNIPIPDGPGGNGNPGAPATHTINIPASTIIDYITVNVDIAHLYVNDLKVEIIHPNGTAAVLVWDRECASEDNIDINFQDGNPAVNCAATTGDYDPSNPLSLFSGLDAVGNWTISVTDNWDAITGTINDWSIEVCSQPTASVDDKELSEFTIYPNPNNGTFMIASSTPLVDDVNVEVFDLRGRLLLSNSYKSSGVFNQNIKLKNAEAGMYLVKIKSNTKQVIKKILVQ